MKKTIILFYIAGPKSPNFSGVAKFLWAFLGDKYLIDLPRWFWLPLLTIIVPLRSFRIKKLYALLWQRHGHHPMRHYMQKLRALTAESLNCRVLAISQYDKADFLKQLKSLKENATNNEHIVLAPMFPQYSKATTGSAISTITQLIQQYNAISYSTLPPYGTHPAFIKAIINKIPNYQKNHRLIISFHSYPRRYIDAGDQYEQQCKNCYEAIVKGGAWPAEAVQIAFQSRFGSSRWVQPYLLDVLKQLASNKHTVHVISPGFIADCLETTVELGEEAKSYYLSMGGEAYHYHPSSLDPDVYINILKESL